MIRNVVLLGHYRSGKTSIGELMLFRSGATSRLGSVSDGTSASDYDPIEIERKMSISLALLPMEWKGHKINVLDTPGYADFAGEVKAGLRVADGALVFVCAASSVEVGTEQVWAYAREAGIPAAIVITKMDRENADFHKTLADIQAQLSSRCVAVHLPMGAEASFSGYIDLVSMKAYVGDSEQAIPAELMDEAQSLREKLVETVVEADDDLMSRYLEGGEISDSEIEAAVKRASAQGIAVPVFVTSAVKSIGIEPILECVCSCLPSPVEQQAATSEIVASDSGPLAAIVFKTTADPFTGKISYFRVYSGQLESNSQTWNVNKKVNERIGQLFLPLGKQQTTVAKVGAGDIGAIAKLSATSTGDTLGARELAAPLAGIAFPNARYSLSVQPDSKADLDKLSTVLPRMVEEDPSLVLKRDPDTGETLMSGLGDTHLEVVKDRMNRKFGVKVVLDTPAVPYRETITQGARTEHKHKKQTGGHGQYGHVVLQLDPLPRGSGFQYEVKIVGGAIPNNFLPSVEKGVNEGVHEGGVGGFPIVDVKVTVVDGSFHAVDSSDIAFKIAASQALKKALQQGSPVLLEPIMNLTIRVPDGMTGDIISDLNTKRGRVQGMNPEGKYNVVTAQAPYAEVLRYSIDLRSMLQGRGDFEMEFDHYELVPAHIGQRIIEQHAEKAEKAE
ncbi:MAG: elongation factor G [Dehalococcoidia bacterium]|nr:elongation factor G [Dehalococcoidia bacterium]